MTGEQHIDETVEKIGDPIQTGIKPQPNPNIISKCETVEDKPDLIRVASHQSHHDIHAVASHASSYVEVNQAQYEPLTPNLNTLSPSTEHAVCF